MANKIDLKEIFKDNVTVELEDGSKIIGPGPCPLKISDWMSFLSGLWINYDRRISQTKTWMYTSLLMYFAIGTFILAIFSNIIDVKADPNMLMFLAIGIYLGVFVGSVLTTKFFERIMEHQVECRDKIYTIINSIIFGTLREPNLIREIFDSIAQELHIKSEQLIRELKLHKTH